MANIDKSLLDGFENLVASFYSDGSLKRIDAYKDSKVAACLELELGKEKGAVRYAIAGEDFENGIIQPTGPFAGSDLPRQTKEKFRQWILRHLEKMPSLST